MKVRQHESFHRDDIRSGNTPTKRNAATRAAFRSLDENRYEVGLEAQLQTEHVVVVEELGLAERIVEGQLNTSGIIGYSSTKS